MRFVRGFSPAPQASGGVVEGHERRHARRVVETGDRRGRPGGSGFEFAQVAIRLAIPGAKTIHLVGDNLNIHRRKTLANVFGAEMAAAME
jgi:hypothetical protein